MRPSKRDQILAASQKALAHGGYQNTTISDIVREARVSRATFYLHFKNKRELLEELLDRFVEELSQVIVRVNSEGAIFDQLKGNIDRVLLKLEENQDLARLLLREAVGIDPEFDERLMRFYDRLAEMVERSLKRGIAMKLARPCDARLVGICVIGQIREIVVQRMLGKRITATRQEIVEEILKLNLQGILKAPLT